jgi:hypothetical protein
MTSKHLASSVAVCGPETDGQSAIRLRPMLLAACLCALLTLPVAWNARQFISADGLSYLEVASNTIQFGPRYLLSNGYWSPGYPALLTITMKLTRPSPAFELAVVHSLDWVICVFTYSCFTFFFFNLLTWIQLAHGPVFKSNARFFSILTFAYALLFVSNIDVTLWLVGPFVLTEGFVYLAAGLCVLLSLPRSRFIHNAALGVVLALAYVAKAPLFPLSLVLLAIFFVHPVARQSPRTGTALALVSFLLAASPLVATLSYSKGRLTFGDAGRLNYAWHVNGVPRTAEWDGDSIWDGHVPGAHLLLLHPPKTISTNPTIVKFDGPFSATHSFWYDPSYWLDGIQMHFDLRQQIRTLLRSFGMDPRPPDGGLSVFGLAVRWVSMLAGVVAFTLLGLRFRALYDVIKGHIWLFLWPAFAGLMFACVVIESRYLVPFVVLGWTALFVAASIVIPPERSIGVTLTVAAGLLLTYCPDLARSIVHTLKQPAGWENLAVAGKLEALGIQRSDELASVNWPFEAYPARLVGARFDMEVVAKDPEAFSNLPEAEVRQILATLRANGAKALFSQFHPAFRNDSGWVQISENAYVRLLQ